MAGRFIKLYDKILNWEWYKNINVKVLFLHLLLKANYKDMSFEGHTIHRGQLVTSLPSLSAETGLSTKQIRGSLEHLISTGEVASKAYPRYRIITVLHYDDYQSEGRQTGSQMAVEWAGKGQAKGRPRAGERAPSIDNIEQIEEYRTDRNIDSPTEREGRTAQRFSPPSRDEIEIFCLENGLTIDVDRFLDYYTSNGWMVGKSHMKDWQATVRNWARRDQQQAQPKEEPVKWFDRPAARPAKQVVAQQYKQRAYDDVQAELLAEQDREMEEWMRNGGGA